MSAVSDTVSKLLLNVGKGCHHNDRCNNQPSLFPSHNRTFNIPPTQSPPALSKQAAQYHEATTTPEAMYDHTTMAAMMSMG